MRYLASYRRRGSTTLIELAAVTFVASAALGLVGSSLASLARVDAKFDHLADGRSDLDRFTSRVRSDLHAAQTVTYKSPMLELAMREGEIVIYSVRSGRAKRETEGVIARFRLPSGCGWAISTEGLSRDRLVEVTFLSEEESQDGVKEVFASILAEVNRDARRSIAGGAR